MDILRTEQPELFHHLKTEYFDFTITPDTIHKRQGVPRPSTQRQVMGGTTAKQMFEECGAKIIEGIQMHLAHRHGWSLGGAQSSTNLDPATYTTLLWIEAPFKAYVLQHNIEKVNIKGTVIFHPLLPKIPIKITYEMPWRKGRNATMSIYPLELRKPTYSEHVAAKEFLKFIRTPKKSKPDEDPNLSQDENPKCSI